MPSKHRMILFWVLAVAAAVTGLAVIGITGFEIYVRWVVNQNYTVLGGDGLPGLMLLLSAEILSLVWLTRS